MYRRRTNLGRQGLIIGLQLSTALVACTGHPGVDALEQTSDVNARAPEPDVRIVVEPRSARDPFEGFGTSLAWWARAVGGGPYESLYADLFFSEQPVSILGRTLPGLGFAIARYNVGGGGRPGDLPDTPEQLPAQVPWFKDIDGFWVNWFSRDPTSTSWDFTRDAEQRSMLAAALARGVGKVELFSNAPMWWMMDSKSSAGGSLQSWNRRDLAVYVATVAEHALRAWGVPVVSVEPFNEPSAGWWRYPTGQEGANIPAEEQADVLAALREELDARGLSPAITASDENTMVQAKATLEALARRSVSVSGRARPAAELVEKVNVHAYSGLEPWRDNGARAALRAAAGARRTWMSEYGDNDGSGLALAQTLVEDLNHLRPTAWIYWQALEPFSAWGLVNAEYGASPATTDRGRPTWIYTKYYVMAQFSRFLRPGCQLLESPDPWTVVAIDPSRSRLVVVSLNVGAARRVEVDLSSLGAAPRGAEMTVTHTDGSVLFETTTLPVPGSSLTFDLAPGAVGSVVVGL